jgi:hypothetical protein
MDQSPCKSTDQASVEFNITSNTAEGRWRVLNNRMLRRRFAPERGSNERMENVTL